MTYQMIRRDADAKAVRIVIIAILSIAWLLVCVGIAWLVAVPLGLPKMIFGEAAAAAGLRPAKPREAMETIAFLLFVSTWFPLAILHVRSRVGLAAIRSLADGLRRPAMALVASAPWVFLLALLLWGEEVTLYMAQPLKFRDWAFFQNFATYPLFYSLAAAALLALALASAKGPVAARRLAEIVALGALCLLVIVVSWNLAFVAPTPGYGVDADAHHKSAVLSPVVDFMLSGETSQSQYGRYYVWGGAFAKLMATMGADPLAAVGGFFFLSLVASFAAYGLAARLAAGSWVVALIALAASIAFAGIRFRGFSYLQVEPIRWMFPALFLLAYAVAFRCGGLTRSTAAALFGLIPFALHWNPETGLACVGATVYSLAAVARKREVMTGAASGLGMGIVALIGLASLAAWYCSGPSTAAMVTPQGSPHAGPLLAFAFMDVVSAPVPPFHLWQLIWLLACLLFVFASRDLANGETGNKQTTMADATLQMGAAMTLLMLFYYQGISVPGTLRSLAFPLILALSVAAFRSLREVPLDRLSPIQLSNAAVLIPLACLAVLGPVNGGSLGRTFDPRESTELNKEAKIAAAVCDMAEKFAAGREVLYLSQDAWWYGLSCGKPINRALVAPSLILSSAQWEAWLARIGTAGVVLFEEALAKDRADHGRMQARLPSVAKVLRDRNAKVVRIGDSSGQVLLLYVMPDDPAGKVQ